MKVSVYLGSALGCLPEYKALAYQLGKKLAENNHTVVYGGADVGTMKNLADGVLDAEGEIIGVFPRAFAGTAEVVKSGVKVVRDGLTEMIWVADFAERKKVMEKLSDCCIVLPGSFGTLDEMFTYACDNAIGEHDKTVYVLNHNGFYNPMKELIKNIAEARFLKAETVDIVQFCDTVDEFIEKL